MSKTVKPNRPHKQLSFDSDLFKRMESFWTDLLQIGEPGGDDQKLIIALSAAFDDHPDTAEIFLKKIAPTADLAAVRLLIFLNEKVTSKGAHKLIKRTLYLLQQKGPLSVPEIAQALRPGTPGILKEIAPAEVWGYLSEFDEGGNRMAALLIPKGTQGRVFILALINAEGEMESLSLLEVNKREAKRIITDLEEQTNHTLLEAAPEHTAFVIQEAHDRGSHLLKSDEAQWTMIFNLLTGLKAVGHSPIIRSLLYLEQAASEERLDMNRLLAIPETDRFQISPETIEPYRKAIAAVQEGVLIVSREQKSGQVENIVKKATEEIFQGEVRIRLIRFLEEVAYLYYLKGQRSEAGVLLQAANSMDPSQGSKGNPFLTWMMGRILVPDRDQTAGPNLNPEMEATQGGIIIPPWVNKEGLIR